MHVEPFKTSRFVGFFLIINKYSATMKPAMHCSHPISKNSGYCLRYEAVASVIILNHIFLSKHNRCCYRKSPFNPGIQVWLYMIDTYVKMVDFKESLLTQISGASYPWIWLALVIGNNEKSIELPILRGGMWCSLIGRVYQTG